MSQPQPITDNTLNLMRSEAAKTAGFTITLFMKDGTKRKGTYLDLVVNPLNNEIYNGVEFIKFKASKSPYDIIYLPIVHIAAIDWEWEI